MSPPLENSINKNITIESILELSLCFVFFASLLIVCAIYFANKDNLNPDFFSTEFFLYFKKREVYDLLTRVTVVSFFIFVSSKNFFPISKRFSYGIFCQFMSFFLLFATVIPLLSRWDSGSLPFLFVCVITLMYIGIFGCVIWLCSVLIPSSLSFPYLVGSYVLCACGFIGCLSLMVIKEYNQTISVVSIFCIVISSAVSQTPFMLEFYKVIRKKSSNSSELSAFNAISNGELLTSCYFMAIMTTCGIPSGELLTFSSYLDLSERTVCHVIIGLNSFSIVFVMIPYVPEIVELWTPLCQKCVRIKNILLEKYQIYFLDQADSLQASSQSDAGRFQTFRLLLRDAFYRYDLNHDGILESSDLVHHFLILSERNATSNTLSKSELEHSVENLMQAFDLDGNDNLTFNSFFDKALTFIGTQSETYRFTCDPRNTEQIELFFDALSPDAYTELLMCTRAYIEMFDSGTIDAVHSYLV